MVMQKKLCLVSLLLLEIKLGSGQYEEAVRLEGSDRGLVLEYFAALSGEPLALLAMGTRHLHGRGVPKSCVAALEYYQAAADFVPSLGPPPPLALMKQNQITGADLVLKSSGGAKTKKKEILRYYKYMSEQGETDAQYALGHLYYYGGRGMSQNFDKAFALFEEAARKGNNLNAASYYGHMLSLGIGCQANNTEAQTWLQKAIRANAKENQALAMTSLALLELKKKADTEQAQKFLQVASELGHPDAMYNLALFQLGWNFSLSVTENEHVLFSPSQKKNLANQMKTRKKQTKSSFQLLSVASQSGQLQASKMLGKMYAQGALGVQRSCPLAVSNLKLVAERGPWIFELKKAYDSFRHGDYTNSLYIYKKFAEAGYELAQLNAALLEHKINDNLHQALRLYQLAADQSNPDALLAIGHIHFRHLLNYDLAAKFFISSYQFGRNAEAAFYLGFLYQTGLGIHKDWHLAKRHYQLAAQLNPLEGTWPSRLGLIFLYLDPFLSPSFLSMLLHPQQYHTIFPPTSSHDIFLQINQLLASTHHDHLLIISLLTLLLLLLSTRLFYFMSPRSPQRRNYYDR